MDADPDTNNRQGLVEFRLSQTERQRGNNLTWVLHFFFFFRRSRFALLNPLPPTFSLLLTVHLSTLRGRLQGCVLPLQRVQRNRCRRSADAKVLSHRPLFF